jgi:hypothetical protein
MAIVAGTNSGVPSLRDASQSMGVAYPKYGVAASITTATNAASASIQLPVDANSKLYSAYVVLSNTLVWVNINTAGDAAVAGAANTYLVNGNGLPVVIPTPNGMIAGATAQISAINDSQAGASKVCVIGIW